MTFKFEKKRLARHIKYVQSYLKGQSKILKRKYLFVKKAYINFKLVYSMTKY